MNTLAVSKCILMMTMTTIPAGVLRLRNQNSVGVGVEICEHLESEEGGIKEP